jgi:molybdopterin synthase catalytic subunit
MSTVDLPAWIAEVKRTTDPRMLGMLLVHNGVVRATSRAGESVGGMVLSVNRDRVAELVEEAAALPGIGAVRAWINEGQLDVGDDIMYVLIAGDIRPRVIPALEQLVGGIKAEGVREEELPG